MDLTRKCFITQVHNYTMNNALSLIRYSRSPIQISPVSLTLWLVNYLQYGNSSISVSSSTSLVASDTLYILFLHPLVLAVLPQILGVVIIVLQEALPGH